MTCCSGSVESVADKSVAARQQIEKLQDMLSSQDAAHKEKFMALVNDNLAQANILDGRQISSNSDIKTEYTSEFSLDKIANVVIKALDAVAKATDPLVPNPATSPDALAAYGDLVNSVAEAAKSSSKAAASLSFSMTRLSPGMFSFLYATTVNILDEDTYGTEAVCSTAVYYCFIQSIDDIKSQAEFNSALIDAQSLIHMKTLQAALIDELSDGSIDINVWTAKDTAYSAAIQRLQERLDAHKFKGKPPLLGGSNTLLQQSPSEASLVANAAVEKLEKMGPVFNIAIERTKNRLNNFYF
ncbi:hypothetical protein RYR28_002115 [Edwardsiella piscicida]|uniref:hypothetical protein n=1 Tax=Edwardsiella piscicida TaxID=1263550 RepID=UPI000B273165|nr:hypothetical protein [Edwardsiella piscicida]EKS7767967.1 hypothetical protein [Edwardsiella piscicida]EKS7780185.1 hypothetical protein [Edwardsiella piscicida]EKS7783925.1 hypothetical protein [Edwardsiella piscicida]EKS7814615.1 hypothetical protein [Edwardsiella piscicida]ELM3658928.1 hypothetical protein [Edwardsiella piscicida]